MKKILVLAFTFMGLNCFGQQILEVTRQEWGDSLCNQAAGACPFGHAYTITIKGLRNELKNFKAESVCIDGRLFTSKSISVTIAENNTETTIRLKMHYSDGSYGGLDRKREVKEAWCNKMQICYITGRGYPEKILPEITELEGTTYN